MSKTLTSGFKRMALPLFTLFVTWLAIRAYWWSVSHPWPLLDWRWVEEGLLKFIVWIVPALAIASVVAIRRRASLSHTLGLNGVPAKGYLFGLAATLPMAAVAVLDSARPVGIDPFLGSVLLGPLAEEIFFRGFLFLMLVRFAGWPVLAAALVSALAFGIAHRPGVDVQMLFVLRLLSGGPDWATYAFRDFERIAMSLAPFVVAGLLFAWITYRWGSIWPAIGLHSFVNLWWERAEGDNGLASLRRVAVEPLPLAHLLAVAIAIGLTFYVTRKPSYWPPRPRPVAGGPGI